MPHDMTLHVKLDSQTNEQLSRLATARGTSKGRLVRDAISACFHVPIDGLPVQQARALAAFEGGFISSGKLAESLGMPDRLPDTFLDAVTFSSFGVSRADGHPCPECYHVLSFGKEASYAGVERSQN